MSDIHDRIANLSPEKRALLEGLRRRGDGASRSRNAPGRIVPLPPDSEPVLSFAQERLWFLSEFDPDNVAYNIVVPVGFRGPLDLAAFERTLNGVVARHQTLRSRFRSRDGKPVLEFLEQGQLRMPVDEMPGLDEAARNEAIDAAYREQSLEPFDLANGPLLRARMLRFGDELHVLMLAVHHIVTDEWSARVLFGELSLLYRAELKGVAPELEPLKVQYADYAAWQRDRLKGDALERQLAYWRDRLGGFENQELPLDRPRPPRQTFDAGSVRRKLSRELSDALRSFARSHSASLFMTLLCGFTALLGRYSSHGDVVVAVGSADRESPDVEDLIGFFVNTLALRTDVSDNPSFEALLERVKENTLSDYAHQSLPFEKIVEALGVERDTSRNPITQVAFTLQNRAIDALELEGLEVFAMTMPQSFTRFDIELFVRDDEDGFPVKIVFNRDLFSVETIERMLEYYERLLEALITAPGQRTGDVELLVGNARRQVLEQWNESTADYPRDETVVSLFSGQVLARGDACALEFGDRRMSYAELDAVSDSVATALRARGVEHGDVVGVSLPRSVEMVVCWLGILKAGATYLPLDPSYPASRLRFMLSDSAAGVVIVEGDTEGVLETDTAAVLEVQEALSCASPRDGLAAVSGDALDAAYIVYTSGSTGEPKGVVVPHRGIVRLVCGADYVQLTQHDRVAQASNVSFDAATFEVWGSLLNGGCLVGVEPDTVLDPAGFAALLSERDVTTLFVTTALFNQFSYLAPSGFNTLTTLLFGGEAVDVEAVRRVKAAGGPSRLLHVYGPTESTTFSSWYEIGDVPEDAVTIPIGQAVSNTRLCVLGERQELLPVGVEGELYIGGDGLALGYLNRDALTAERFVDVASPGGERAYRTGDRVRWRSDGALEFVGRRDHQVKLRGYRIELGEVETALTSQAYVHEAVVLCREDIPGDKRLVGYVVLEPEADIGVETLRANLLENLPAYMVPSVVMALPSIPLTPVGKLDRAALPEPVGEDSVDDDFIAPSGAVEEQIAAIWMEVLGVERVGAADSFFDLGGHSLLAMQLVSRVRDSVGVELSLREVFTMPTLRAMAGQVQTALPQAAPQSSTELVIEPRADGERATLSFGQKRMWFLSHLDVAAEAYKVLVPLRLKGPLDIARMERAFESLVERHEVLRTTYEMHDGEVVQVIHSPGPFAVSVSETPDGAGFDDEYVGAWLDGIRIARFDLERGPLLRADLMQCTADDHVLVISMH
ncbi:MAG: amino acid adenylation domain-containing protein, partial [Gammaproteobacteria bacterium]|nr:amino acid adenylation domain-containing protein [Gammaproteobacteria bacterium]